MIERRWRADESEERRKVGELYKISSPGMSGIRVWHKTNAPSMSGEAGKGRGNECGGMRKMEERRDGRRVGNVLVERSGKEEKWEKKMDDAGYRKEARNLPEEVVPDGRGKFWRW